MTILYIFVASVFAVLLILSQPTSDKAYKKRLERQKHKAMHPRPPAEMLKRIPGAGDIVLGKYKNKYCVWDKKREGHVTILGGSGSGKSSSLIIPLIMNTPKTPLFVVDVKGELLAKTGRKDDKNTIIFAPLNHDSSGFDLFYSLSSRSNQQEIHEVMQTIAFSLVPVSGSSDSFWPLSARSLLLGLLIRYWNAGVHDFIGIIDRIMGAPVQEQITEVINEVSPAANEYKYLVQFSDMASETLLSVYSNLAICISMFSTDEDLRWCLSGAERKTSPEALEEGKSIFLQIPDYKLEAWAKLLGCIINVTLGCELSKRPEGRHRIICIFDELGRIVGGAGMDSLPQAIMICRSKGVSIVMALQTVQSLEAGFSKSMITTLIGNCSVKIILDASSSDTQKMVTEDWIPQYIETRGSKSVSRNNSASTSYEYRPTVAPADLMELVKNKELLAVTPLGFVLLKKCPYYSDKYFLSLKK